MADAVPPRKVRSYYHHKSQMSNKVWLLHPWPAPTARRKCQVLGCHHKQVPVMEQPCRQHYQKGKPDSRLSQTEHQHVHQEAKAQAYDTFVRPTLEYASTVWDPHTARNINAIEMVQRRAARFTTGNYHRTSSVSAMLNALSWDSLQMRRARAKTIMLFRIHYRLIDVPPEQYLIPTGSHTRGHNIKFLQPLARIQAYQHSFFPSAVRY